MRERIAGAIVGVIFGVSLSWTGLIDPAVIRQGLLFEDAYLFLLFAAAVAVAFAGTQILRAMRPRALITGEPVEVKTDRPQRRQLGGAAVFGVGWAIAGACPGPIAAQLGQGVVWSLFTMAGVLIGIVAYLRSHTRRSAARPDRSSVSDEGAGPARPATQS